MFIKMINLLGKEESQAVSKTSSRVGTKNYKFNYTQSSLHTQGHINNSEDIDCGGEITLPSVYEMEQKIWFIFELKV